MVTRLMNFLMIAIPQVTSAVGEGAAKVAENPIATAVKAASAGLCIGLASIGAGMGMGRIGQAALEGITRQPEMAGRIFTSMLVAMALIEALAIYCLLISFILLK